MPATLDDALSVLLGRVELNPTRVTLASQRYNAVKDVVEANIPGATVRQIGSFQRKTKIRPRDLSDALDVDALAVLGDAHQYAPPGVGTSPAEALELVRLGLRKDKRYRVMDPEADAPVVSLDYSDGFKMEIAVGYRELSGKYPRNGGPACYIVADHGNWRPADYDYDAAVISSLNQHPIADGNLVPMIKLIKQWARNQGVPLKSVHLEILAARVLPTTWQEWKQKGWSGGFAHSMAAFLAGAPALLTGPVGLAGSFSPPLDSGLDPDELLRVASYLSDCSKEAWKLCGEIRLDRAINAWQKFFGDPFPALSGVV